MNKLLTDKQKFVYEIVERLTYPSIPEIIFYLQNNKEQKICRNFNCYGFENTHIYQDIHGHLKSLQKTGLVQLLECEYGYRKRYCSYLELDRLKNKLRPIVRFLEVSSSGDYIYSLGKNKLTLTFHNINSTMRDDSQNILILFDKEIDRYYVVTDTLFVAVIEYSSKKKPRLPGSTYGYGTEYERCLRLIQQTTGDYRLLGVKGERRLIGESSYE